MSKRVFEIYIDTGKESTDKELASMFIDLLSYIEGVTYKFKNPE